MDKLYGVYCFQYSTEGWNHEIRVYSQCKGRLKEWHKNNARFNLIPASESAEAVSNCADHEFIDEVDRVVALWCSGFDMVVI